MLYPRPQNWESEDLDGARYSRGESESLRYRSDANGNLRIQRFKRQGRALRVAIALRWHAIQLLFPARRHGIENLACACAYAYWALRLYGRTQLRILNDYRMGNDLNFSERSRCTVGWLCLATCWRWDGADWPSILRAVRGGKRNRPPPWNDSFFRGGDETLVAPSTSYFPRGQWHGWPNSQRAPLRV